MARVLGGTTRLINFSFCCCANSRLVRDHKLAKLESYRWRVRRQSASHGDRKADILHAHMCRMMVPCSVALAPGMSRAFDIGHKALCPISVRRIVRATALATTPLESTNRHPRFLARYLGAEKFVEHSGFCLASA
eukprot:COSAG02_NODE_6553_length_3500_cov_1.405763_4_plen_135_part_00